MTKDLMNQIILAAGAWKNSNGLCVESEKRFSELLEELKQVESINHEDAVQKILKEVS